MKYAGCSLLLVVLGLSTAAADDGELRDRYNRAASHDPDRNGARHDGRWIEVATPTPSSNGTEFILVGADAGEIAHLRIDATSGRTEVRSIRVEYADGHAQQITIDRDLSKAALPHLVVDLDRPGVVQRLVVVTERELKGRYAIYASAPDRNSEESGPVARSR